MAYLQAHDHNPGPIFRRTMALHYPYQYSVKNFSSLSDLIYRGKQFAYRGYIPCNKGMSDAQI